MPQGKYLDPITHEVIEDPVILCATGMVYGYKSLKQWVPQQHRTYMDGSFQ
jgi:hypothetical protein